MFIRQGQTLLLSSCKNAVFGKIGRFASEEVVLKIIHSKCVPILLYGLEAFPLNKADLNSLILAFL